MMDGVGALMEPVLARAKEGKSELGAGCEGVVTRAGRGDLVVRVGQLPELQKEDLSVNPWYKYDWILDEHQPEYLRPGDKVILLTADGQHFNLICKVVDCT